MGKNHHQTVTGRSRGEAGGRFFSVLLLAGVTVASADESRTNGPILANLSFEQLSQIQITTAAKRSESVANTAAAVTVLQGDDIIRSGATSVPEALRWVPGLDVAQINAAEWAITSRGFNGRFSNKLLVMVDGRSIYTPLLAGVYWDAVNPMLEDLDRIEVVRGPGGALWGANAVNGVINILSKSAKETPGGLAYGGGGTEKQVLGGARYGFTLSEQSWLRVYGKYELTDDSRWPNGASGNDGWDNYQGGFRFDAEPSAQNQFTLQSDFMTGERDRLSPLVTAAGVVTLNQPVDVNGANLLGRWTHDFSAESKFTLQSYYDHTWRDSVVTEETRDTFDVDAQHNWQFGQRQMITWGLGYRWSGDRTASLTASGFVPQDYNFQLASAFVQDEITLVADRLKFTVGGKLEHNSFTGLELQPGVRLLWTPSERQTYWASVARAVRNPNRADTGANFDAYYVPPGPSPANPSAFPLLIRATGNPNIDSETLIAYEAGWRMQVTPKISVDVATFFNDYTDLILGSPDPAATFFEATPAPPHLVTPVVLLNSAKAHSYGGELALTWQPVERVRLAPFYSYLQVDAEQTVAGSRSLTTLEDSAPRHQLGLRSSFDLSRKLKLDVNLRWVDEVPAYNVPSYFAVDARVAWNIHDGLELAVTGQNLTDNQHAEFGAQTIEPRYELERGVYAKLTWRF